ncbi:hypothetical protein L911_1652 [Vibrio fluvialis I21563]|nr:hypothetical protein L911_1652 [Vibrio fluvialis I21563]
MWRSKSAPDFEYKLSVIHFFAQIRFVHLTLPCSWSPVISDDED